MHHQVGVSRRLRFMCIYTRLLLLLLLLVLGGKEGLVGFGDRFQMMDHSSQLLYQSTSHIEESSFLEELLVAQGEAQAEDTAIRAVKRREVARNVALEVDVSLNHSLESVDALVKVDNLGSYRGIKHAGATSVVMP